MEKLKTTHLTDKYPGSLKTAKEIAESLKGVVSPERLRSLANAGYCPHYRIDGGEPQFMLNEIKGWITSNLLERVMGRELPLNLRVYLKKGKNIFDKPPESISLNSDLISIDIQFYPTGVYFLCQENEVVYVGKSVNVLARISAHRIDKEFDRVFMIPVPEHALNSVEGALIRVLEPKYNVKNKSGRVIAPAQDPDKTDDMVLEQIEFKIDGGEKWKKNNA